MAYSATNPLMHFTIVASRRPGESRCVSGNLPNNLQRTFSTPSTRRSLPKRASSWSFSHKGVISPLAPLANVRGGRNAGCSTARVRAEVPRHIPCSLMRGAGT